MATFNKHNAWVEYMCEAANCGSDQFVVYLTNTLPTASNSLIADITQISYTNCSSRNITTSSASHSSGTYTVVFSDLVLTASGGTVGPFRYIGIYDDTVASDPLVGWYEHPGGASITLQDGETLTIDFGASVLSLT